MHPLAMELNRRIETNNPRVHEMLSPLGKALFFPKGILSQSAEAKEKAHRFNATIGIALEHGKAMYLPCIHDLVGGLPPDEIFPYAPAAGKPALRRKWKEKQEAESPSLRDKELGTPIVTHALTHGLTLVGDLFFEPGDPLVLPDKLWGNYRLIFEVRRGARIVTYPFYTSRGGFDVEAMDRAIEAEAARANKVIVLLNFPNNPSGYTLSLEEADRLCRALVNRAERGTNLLVVLDEAYHGLFYEEGLLTESLLGRLANQHERLLVVKLDGATKEEFVWGFRVGFLTFGAGPRGDLPALYEALEKKVMGAIRGSVSNASHLSQTLILKALESPDFRAQQAEKFEILRARAKEVSRVLRNPKYEGVWRPYPFNSGYFMCLRLQGVEAEALRRHLLDRYGVGVIATDTHDIRIAFSCIEKEQIEQLFDLIHQGVQDLASS